MAEDEGKHITASAFAFGEPSDPFASEAGIDAYLRECQSTGDEEIIRDAEYLAMLARQRLIAG